MRSKVLLLSVVCLSLLFARPAAAAFFDDEGGSKWWMAADQWQEFTYLDPFDKIVVEEAGDTLQFRNADPYADGWEQGTDPGYENGAYAEGILVSKWALSLAEDFEFTAGYHYSYTNNRNKSDEGGLGLGLVYLDPAPTEGLYRNIYLGAENRVDPLLTNHNYFLGESSLIGDEEELTPRPLRSFFDGTIKAEYDAATGDLDLIAYENGAEAARITEQDIRSQLDGITSYLFVYFDGGSDGAALKAGDAYISDFDIQLGKAVVTPEPASMLLFGLGGAALAFGGRKRLFRRA